MLFVFAFLLVGTPSIAEELRVKIPIVCNDRAIVLDELQGRYGETLRWQGVFTAEGGNGVMTELWHAKNSWTITMTRMQTPDIVCMVSAGNGHRIFNKEPEPTAY